MPSPQISSDANFLTWLVTRAKFDFVPRAKNRVEEWEIVLAIRTQDWGKEWCSFGSGSYQGTCQDNIYFLVPNLSCLRLNIDYYINKANSMCQNQLILFVFLLISLLYI